MPKRCRGGSNDPVDMAPDATARDGEAELATIAFLGDQIDPGRAQPADGEILELMADREDAQRSGRRSRAPSSFGAAANSNCSARSQACPRRDAPR